MDFRILLKEFLKSANTGEYAVLLPIYLNKREALALHKKLIVHFILVKALWGC